MMKCCNKKHFHLNMLKWSNKYGLTAHRIQRWIGEMVKQLYSPSSNISFMSHSVMGTKPSSSLYWILHPSYSQKVSQNYATFVVKLAHELLQCPLIPSPLPPWFHFIDLSFSFLPPPPTPGGFVRSSIFLYLSIVCCSCTGNTSNFQEL